jgi:hypothetical protein
MRTEPLWVILAAAALSAACGPRGVQTTKTDEADADADADADGDADADADGDSDADTDTEPGPSSCAEGPADLGPWDFHPITTAGAGVTYDPYAFVAGVGDAAAAAVGQQDLAVNIPITGAIVTARDYVPKDPKFNTVSFWFEDADAAMFAFNVEVPFDPNELLPGDELSFTVTEVNDYFGTLEVTAVSDFTVVASGRDVRIIRAMDGQPLDFATQGLRNVEVYGELVSGPVDCASNCFELEYAGNIVTFRTGSDFVYLGDCIHWIGPLGTFDSAEQLDAGDFDWYRYY